MSYATLVRSLSITLVSVTLASVGPRSAEATTISQEYVNLTGSLWQADFTVTNDSLLADIYAFFLIFEPQDFASIALVGSPTDWDAFVAQPGPGEFDYGNVYWVTAVDAIAPRTTLGGFSLTFEWVGPECCGFGRPLNFEIFDPESLSVVEIGGTEQAVIRPTTVPEPGSFALLSLGLLGVHSLTGVLRGKSA